MNQAPGPLPFVLRRDGEGEGRFEELLRLVDEQESFLAERLLAHGAILLRGWPVRSCEQFAQLVEALSGRGSLLRYRGGASPRRSLSAGSQPVYNSTEYPPDLELSLHNELSYSSAYPDRIYFLCLTAPAQGGETTLGDSRRILAGLPPAVRARFETKGVRYIRTLPSVAGSGYSWQDAFGTEDRAEVERHCAAIGAEHEWLGCDLLRVMEVRPATALHPATGEEIWFNQADGFHPSALDPATHAELLAQCGSEDRFRLNVSFGDGAPIAPADLDAVRQVIRRESRPHAWRTGDVLMLDNLLAAHGRRPFSGERRIAVAMS
ncbi:MAG TPA: TauD/TfdA family dioxygenase [Allosphingosinicella sp.]|jgi:alpha-ketoglutarate-dependent taurine dioxygenase